MTRPAAATVSCPGGAATATATAVLVGTGAASWSWVLRGSLVGIALLVAVAAVTVLLAAQRLSSRLAAGLLAGWLAAAVWAGGAPAGQLLPPAWPSLAARLATGVKPLTTPGSGPIANQPWPLAAWLLGAGVLWVAGAALAASGPWSARRRAIAFGVLAAPWIAAVAIRQTDRAAWQGGAVLLAGLLWFAARRMALRSVLALGLAVALTSVGISQAIGPRTNWFARPSPSGAAAPFPALKTELTYGPLPGRRRGATMLEITAAQPGLWRMRVLTLFAGPGWRVDSLPELPQPAAEPEEVTIVVRGLGNDLAVAPGRIDAVHADGRATRALGESWQLTPPPRRGNTYRVRARVVRVTTQQLQHAPAPSDPRLHPYTSLTPGYQWPSDAVVPLFGQPPNPRVSAALDGTPYGPVAALARHLTAGATTQWEVVAQVHRYLLDGDRFRYTTNLARAGPFPLVDFLLRDHVGDCQHFAGAAALLLRLAGVPTRVVVGFATGVRQPDGRFNVRDIDAHAWIEVYFQGYGWVAFNPTPPAAQASIPPHLDPLASASATTGSSHDHHGGPDGLGWLAVGAILVALTTAGIWTVRRRTRRGPVPLRALLEGLVCRTGGRVQPSTTLAELGIELARLVGPQTAALAGQTERVRFALDSTVATPRPRIQLARALAKDLGPRRALLMLIAPLATRQARERPPWTA
jgi:hypothetical protein